MLFRSEPGNFLTEAELRGKFHGLADAVLGEAAARGLADAVLDLVNAPSVEAMLARGARDVPARLAGE